MSAFGVLNIPNIETGNLNNAKYAQMVANYLMELNENLQYMFSHIEEDNMTNQTVKNLTASYINVTNGDNSMILDPDVGFKMTKGSKNQFFFNIITGEAEFGGKIKGATININEKFIVDEYGKITCNYNDNSVVIENGKIYTSYGLIKTFFDGKSIIIGDGIDFGSANYAEMKGGYLFLSDGGTTGAKYIELNPLSNRFKISDGWDDYNILHSGMGTSGTFSSEDGKIITVTNGLIVNIV